ncbi:MAG: presenilin family intramembrane aspartyl protease [Candidatus Pacearchaeota archaeon]
MKHKFSITLIILGMFLITQTFGLFLISRGDLPEFIRGEGEQKNITGFFNILIAFIISLTFFFFLIQYKWKFFIKIWFGLIIFISLTVTFYAFLIIFFKESDIVLFYSLLLSIIFTFLKILRPSVVIHNITEIFIYSGVSLIFVHYLTPFYAVLFLILISFYDMWAVWHTGIMQKMAKFQMEEVKIFNGFLIPYLTKEIRNKIKQSKKRGHKKIKIKVPLAILGGGDIAFTLIPAGVFLLSYGVLPAVFVVLGGFLGLCFIMFFSEKKKAYPAMPFITSGIFLMLFVYFFILRLFL